MKGQAWICVGASLPWALAACVTYQPSMMHPTLATITRIEQAMDCPQIDQAIDRAETVRWLIRDDGGRLETSSERHARYAVNVIMVPLWVLGPAFIVEPGHTVLNAADSRIRELLQLKRTHGCPPRPTALPGMDEFAVLGQLESVQARIDAGPGDEASLFTERTRLLDGLRVVPPPAPRSQAASAQKEEPLATWEEPAQSIVSRDPLLPSRMPQVDDTWKYRYMDRWTNLLKGPFVHQIVAVSASGIRERTRVEDARGGTEHVFTANAEFVQSLSGIPEFGPYLQAFAVFDETRGWDGVLVDAGDGRKWVFSGHVAGIETVVLPAGRFAATRVELDGKKDLPGLAAGASSGHVFITDPIRAKFVLWYAPEVKRVLKYTRETYGGTGQRLDDDIYELVEFRLN